MSASIPTRENLLTSVSSSSARIRRLELAMGGTKGQVRFTDGTLFATTIAGVVIGWTGRLRTAPFKGSAASVARVYLDMAVTRNNAGLGGSLEVGQVAADARPPFERDIWAVDANITMVRVTIKPDGIVSVDAEYGSEIVLTGSYIL
jgi:hypothetical protein